MKLFHLFFVCIMSLAPFTGQAQDITVVTEQGLNFGSFYITGDSSGSVSVSNTGGWASSSNIYLINTPTSAAVFKVSTNSSQPITIQADQPTIYLTNPRGEQLLLETRLASPLTATVQMGAPAQLMLGGTLHIPAQAKPGAYSGELLVNFSVNYE